MKFNYCKKLGRGLTVASIITLSSLGAISYQGQAIANGNSGGHGGGAGNSQGRGTGNSLGDRSELIKAENASDIAREHAAHNSAVILAYPEHLDDGHTHDADVDPDD
jgi:hypothetical protein